MERVLAACPVVLVAFAACSMFGDHEDRVLMPLDLGNSWTYTVTQARVPSARLTYRIVDHIRNDNTTFAAIEIEEVSLTGDVLSADTIYAANEVGLTFFGAPNYGSEVIDYFRFPVERHDRYWSPNGDQMCTSSAEDIAVPAGSFDVLIYGPCEDYDANRTMFVPDTGMTYSGDYDKRALHLATFDLK